jgi:sugar phosphate isomerase/epimerase
MADAEIVASYWTVAGPTEPAVGREWSLFGWPARCQEAATAGFVGLGLWHADIEHLLESYSLARLGTIFADAGLSCFEAEFLTDFFTGAADPARPESDRRRRLLFDAAAAFGAHHIKVGNLLGRPCELDRVTEAFADLCQDTAANTDARVAYEFMPFDANVRTLDAALRLVEDAAQPNGGLAIDTWHMAKLGIAPAELSRVPPRYLTWVELSDGQLADMADLGFETLNHRRLPGEGEFDLAGYVAAVRAAGYRGPWGVEVISAEQRGLPMDAEFRRAFETTAALLRDNHG